MQEENTKKPDIDLDDPAFNDPSDPANVCIGCE